MIIVRLAGGLGNQLFQYALGRKLSLLHNRKLFLDLSSYESYPLRKYELNSLQLNVSLLMSNEANEVLSPKGINKYLNKLGFSHSKVIVEDESKYFLYNNEIFSHKTTVLLLEGYWQNPAYFDSIRHFLIQDIVKPELIRNQKTLNDIVSTQSVALHIRRGDYVKQNPDDQIHQVLNMDYYHHSIQFLNNLYNNLSYYIFSDDPEWCKREFNYPNFIIIDPASNPLEDLLLMTHCNHFIIANSSFSWWAAWLNNRIDKKVIAPIKWFSKDLWDTSQLIPKDWVRF